MLDFLKFLVVVYDHLCVCLCELVTELNGDNMTSVLAFAVFVLEKILGFSIIIY